MKSQGRETKGAIFAGRSDMDRVSAASSRATVDAGATSGAIEEQETELGHRDKTRGPIKGSKR